MLYQLSYLAEGLEWYRVPALARAPAWFSGPARGSLKSLRLEPRPARKRPGNMRGGYSTTACYGNVVPEVRELAGITRVA